ncbi:pentapeptide repeat-containing protein [Dactylosporangium sp. CA-233914]|uniref:pentapeptide repeat-containing protein n=1 Tax=Dactylosporangium sp. CA-233914 TaxID=3239934 RepID=UPI003D8DB1D2
MAVRNVHDIDIELPVFDPGELEPVSAPWGGNLNEAHVQTGRAIRTTLIDARLRRSHLENLDLNGVTWEDVAISGCRFEKVDFTAARLTGLTLERVHFVNCKLTWANLAESRLSDVLFEGCRLDGASLDDVSTAGPTGFVGCVLVNTNLRDCALPYAAMQGCRLRQMSFESCDLRGADLRGNQLSEVSGMTSLRGVTIEPAQLPGLTDAVMRDLGVIVRGPKG